MARFKIGQHIICLKKGQWKKVQSGTLGTGPTYLEEVTVAGYNPIYPTGVILHEYPLNPEGYEEHNFEPVADITELKEALKKEPATV